jgi:hypothetical protein
MEENETILVIVDDDGNTRKGNRFVQEVKVEVLAENVNLFLGQIEKMIANTPEEVNGKFRLTEFSVAAEISATGSLILLGSGVEASGKTGITFTFTRK